MLSACATVQPGAWLRTLWLALAVRLLVLCLAFLSDLSFPDYDTSADFFPHICATDKPPSTQQHKLSATLSQRLIVWDSVFFRDISCNGYSHEQQFAFFPLLPALLRLVHPGSAPLLGLLLSTLLCVLSAVLLFQLGQAVTRCPRTSAAASLFFIITPASIFYTAVYTESLFTFLTLVGLCALYVPSRKLPWLLRFAGATAAFTLATAARANGIISAGFILHEALARGLAAMRVPQGKSSNAGVSKDRGGWRGFRHFKKSTRLWGLPKAFLYLVSGLLAALMIAAPVVVHQTHARAAFCEPALYGAHQRAVAECACNSAGALCSRSDERGIAGETGSVSTDECGVCKMDACSKECTDSGALGGDVTQNGVCSSGRRTLHLQSEGKVDDTGQESVWGAHKVGWVGYVDSMLRKGAQGLASSLGSTGDGSSNCSGGGGQRGAIGVQQSPPLPAWCSASPWWRPSIYSYVQENYWGVGLFEYWKVQQVPNFLLAFPALLLAAAACCTYMKQCAAGMAHVVTAGLLWRAQKLCEEQQQDEGQQQQDEGQQQQQQQQQQWQWQSLKGRAPALAKCNRGFLAPLVAHFLFPLAFMAVCAATVMHVQVSTRFLSSSPALYWFMAHLWAQGQEAAGKQAGAGHADARDHGKASTSQGCHWVDYCIWVWSLSFLVAGTVMFPNFYPWT